MYKIFRQQVAGKYVLYYPEDGHRKRSRPKLSFIKYIKKTYKSGSIKFDSFIFAVLHTAIQPTELTIIHNHLTYN
jgi:hypothetical protein